MALLIKYQKNNQQLSGYLRITHFLVHRTPQGGSSNGMGKFFVQVNYSVTKDDNKGEPLMQGSHNYDHDITQEFKPLEQGYLELKKLDNFKDGQDV